MAGQSEQVFERSARAEIERLPPSPPAKVDREGQPYYIRLWLHLREAGVGVALLSGYVRIG